MQLYTFLYSCSLFSITSNPHPLSLDYVWAPCISSTLLFGYNILKLDSQWASNNRIIKLAVALLYISLFAECIKTRCTTNIDITLKHTETQSDTHSQVILIESTKSFLACADAQCRKRAGVTASFRKNFSMTNGFYKIWMRVHGKCEAENVLWF